jgi:hypothetical protein
VVNVDSIGVGHNFALHLRDERFPVKMVNVALPCESKPSLEENDPARRLVNLKARFYQTLADAFEHDQIDGLTDEETIGQLAGIRWELDSQGRIKIESKERARERGVPSPDRAEALMLALCKPPRKYEYYSARDLPQMHSGSGERPNHDDDLDDRPLRSRRFDALVSGGARGLLPRTSWSLVSGGLRRPIRVLGEELYSARPVAATEFAQGGYA